MLIKTANRAEILNLCVRIHHSDIHKNNGFLIILIMMIEISWVLLTANALHLS